MRCAVVLAVLLTVPAFPAAGCGGGTGDCPMMAAGMICHPAPGPHPGTAAIEAPAPDCCSRSDADLETTPAAALAWSPVSVDRSLTLPVVAHRPRLHRTAFPREVALQAQPPPLFTRHAALLL